MYRFLVSAAALGVFIFLAALWSAGWAFLWYHAENPERSITPIGDNQKLNGMPSANILLKAKLASVRAPIFLLPTVARTFYMATLLPI